MVIGDKFNYWTVIDTSGAEKSNNYKIKCVCVCGNEKHVNKSYLICGKSKSCGCHGFFAGYEDDEYRVLSVYSGKFRRASFECLSCGNVFEKRVESKKPRNPCPCKVDYSAQKKHGESPHNIRTKEYNAWRNMRRRCNSPNHKSYSDYGGRGIKVCDRWSDYSLFLADMGRCPENYSIDRIDHDGNYEPSNCRWADKRDQVINRRITVKLTFDGITDYLPNWADKYNISRSALYQRYKVYGDCGNKELLLRGTRAKSRN